ncbi:MAG: dephospho-CoA kinase [Mogibacterium sp.]|nr:dephospho-CoA kinase [Mogibacterium sp.]
MLNIAITGGIGSGKSRVTGMIRSYGYTVIDADAMSREITSAGGKAMLYILENFGSEFINEDGSMNRAAMRDLIFRDPEKKKLLERGTTDVVLADIEAIRESSLKEGKKAVFYDIPLLYETGTEKDYDAVWVVTADREIRKERIMERDHIEESVMDLMIDSQADDDLRVEKADHVIYNNGSLSELWRSVEDALRTYGLL